MIKISDYIWDYLASKELDTVFSVSGGASSHLLDSLSKNKKFKVYFCRHEQACAMAADGYARIANKPAIVLVTNGPGSTNAITGVLGAYQDSIPMIVISGQVPKNQMMEDTNLRQLGVQECDIISIVKPITKFAKTIRYPDNGNLNYDLDQAYTLATTGRMGPVWLEVPLDIQSTQVDEKDLTLHLYENDPHKKSLFDLEELDILLQQSDKPVIVVGNGVHLSKTEETLIKIAHRLYIPVVTTWNAKDIFNYNDDVFIGSFGILGERAGNFAVQNADLLIILGSRLSVPNIGYDSSKFSPNSIKIMVDIDANEISKKTLNIQHKINEPLEEFLPRWLEYLMYQASLRENTWIDRCLEWKKKYPVYQPEYANEKDGINSFHFIEELCKHLKDNHVIVTDMGTAFTCTMQAAKMNGKARLFTSSGTASMGYGLPAAIGAWIADPTKEIILIAGDGGFQMNIQELQTIKQYNIPIKMFILNNNGYLAISLMQDNLFKGNYIGSTPESGVSAPDFCEIAKSYGLKYPNVVHVNKIPLYKNELLDWDILNSKKACLVEIKMPQHQKLFPRVQSSKDEKTGQIISNSLENMYPYLSKEEMKEIMK